MDRTVEHFVHVDGPAQQRIARESKERMVVASAVSNRVRVDALNTPRVVREVVRQQIISGAAQGVRGAPGITGGSVPPIHFSFGDAASIRFVAPNDGVFTIARVDFTTPFNGTNPAFKLGVIGQIEALIAAADNDPTLMAQFENTPDFPVTAGTGVWLEISGSGASQGAGTVYLTFVSEN